MCWNTTNIYYTMIDQFIVSLYKIIQLHVRTTIKKTVLLDSLLLHISLVLYLFKMDSSFVKTFLSEETSFLNSDNKC